MTGQLNNNLNSESLNSFEFLMKNILFVAAHPDDELVGATFIIKKLLQKKNIIIFFLTNGVISKEEMWFWNKKKYEGQTNV